MATGWHCSRPLAVLAPSQALRPGGAARWRQLQAPPPRGAAYCSARTLDRYRFVLGPHAPRWRPADSFAAWVARRAAAAGRVDPLYQRRSLVAFQQSRRRPRAGPTSVEAPAASRAPPWGPRGRTAPHGLVQDQQAAPPRPAPSRCGAAAVAGQREAGGRPPFACSPSAEVDLHLCCHCAPTF